MASKMESRFAQVVKQIWRVKKKIATLVFMFCLLQPGQGVVGDEAQLLTTTQDAGLIYSKCSELSTQRLKLEKFQAMQELSIDFLETFKDITSMVVEFMQQEIKVIEQSKVAYFDCKLKDLCVNTFSLKSLLKAEPKLNRGFVVDFVSIDAQQLMYMKGGQSKFIQNTSFKFFERSNIEIILQNISSHLIYIESSNKRKLVNSFDGICYCKLCSSIRNLMLKQSTVKTTLKSIVSAMLELQVGLKVVLPDDINVCLRQFLQDKRCMYKQSKKVRRSIFSSSDHDDLRHVTKIFEQNFLNIMKHERAKKLELNALHRKLGAEELDLNDLRNFMRGAQVIEKLHKIQVDFFMIFNSNLDILQKNLEHADLMNLIALFKTRDCKFLNVFNKCVFLDSFRISENWIHANFKHSIYKLQNFSTFSCFVEEFKGNFYLNDLHNRMLRPKDVQIFNKTRPIRSSDFVNRNLDIIVTKNIIEKSDCFTIFCTSNTSYKINGTLVECERGSSQRWCDQFILDFEEESISHLNLASHIVRADWFGGVSEEFYHQIPRKIQEQTVNIEEEDEHLGLETEEASSWLLRADLVQILGIALGTFFFVIAAGGVLYLKCRKRGSSTLIVPTFKADTGSVTLNRGGFRQNMNSYEQFTQPELDNPAGPPTADTSESYTASAPPEVTHKRVERKQTRQQSAAGSKGSKRSLVTQTFRTK